MKNTKMKKIIASVCVAVMSTVSSLGMFFEEEEAMDKPSAEDPIAYFTREELLGRPWDGSRDDCLKVCQEAVEKFLIPDTSHYYFRRIPPKIDSEHKKFYAEFLFKCVEKAWGIIPKDAIRLRNTNYFWEYAAGLRRVDIFASYPLLSTADEGFQKSFIINNGEKLTQAQCLMNILRFLAAVFVEDGMSFMKVFDWLESGFLYRPETDPENPKKVFKEFNFTYLEWLDVLEKHLRDGDCYTFALRRIPSLNCDYSISSSPLFLLLREELLGRPWDRSRDDCLKACQRAVGGFSRFHPLTMSHMSSEYEGRYADFLFKCAKKAWEIIPKDAIRPRDTNYFWECVAGLGVGNFRNYSDQNTFQNTFDEEFQEIFIINHGNKLTQAQCLMNTLRFLAAVYMMDYENFMEVFDRLESGFLYEPETDPRNPKKVFKKFNLTYLEWLDILEKHLMDGGCYTFVLRLIPSLNCYSGMRSIVSPLFRFPWFPPSEN
ncbi:MAG: hypothetical protein CfP315_0760 [Candidatus Improbicoccus pseudotrichonymphae]|uniref:Uncharacterized protein n=1 Tax=Candidatus Improbicoccus pseudotrichonymphae TaxID=3033792 RepID=A0AA48I3B8_9FIRM|nr:MAG: hypothetical protein CfP315_0760 [Candidatus Improbicoccus pseudotrichonymphae]